MDASALKRDERWLRGKWIGTASSGTGVCVCGSCGESGVELAGRGEYVEPKGEAVDVRRTV
jgi:hypothetical protein